ncbi:hypothetical protein P7K49_031836 [Saguinus oedipus]|uniref:Uncharacterized protein n=1 Tax=Saguinus oedipus TaxID=9490 RepID=A0ABQ9U1B3_SAGOE|nr:hypothetical protein P7K49_031836 [Saguinus oedipus]
MAQLLVLGSIDPVYTASGHRIRDTEPRKIHRAAVELPGVQERRPRRLGQATQARLPP